MCWRSLRQLLWKSCIQKRRHCCATVCELLLPLGLLVLLALVYNLFEDDVIQANAKIADRQRIAPLAALPFTLQALKGQIAFIPGAGAGAAEDAVIDDLMANLRDRDLFPGINGADAGLPAPLNTWAVPPFEDNMVTRFATEDQLSTHIEDTLYGSDTVPLIYAAVVIHRAVPFEYTIRMNFTMSPSPFFVSNDLKRDQDLEIQTKVVTPRFQNDDRVKWRSPGFASIQLFLDRYLITNNFTSATGTLNSKQFQEAANQLLAMSAVPPQPAATLTTFETPLKAALASEYFLPSSVSVMPFPETSFVKNTYYDATSNVMPLLMIMVLIYPVSRLIKGIVEEKELKIREYLRMLGVSDLTVYANWGIVYMIFFGIIAIFATATTLRGAFKSSDAIFVFLLFFLFGLSVITLCFAISTLFSRAKTASTVGIVLFFGAYFPFAAISDPEDPYSSKVAASILSPTAFALSLNHLLNMENDGQGITTETVNLVIRNFSFAAGMFMMAIDTVLYLLIAWYLEKVSLAVDATCPA